MPTPLYEINRAHTVNGQYFDHIDTEQKAYWLGFLWADGSIQKTAPRSAGPNRLSVAQKEPNGATRFLASKHNKFIEFRSRQ